MSSFLSLPDLPFVWGSSVVVGGVESEAECKLGVGGIGVGVEGGVELEFGVVAVCCGSSVACVVGRSVDDVVA